MNFQDIIHEEYDSSNKAQKVNVVAGVVGQATVNINGSATIFAVVNTGASSDPKSFIGLTTTVIGSSPTIYAVVNTTASGGGNVTLDAGSKTQIIGNLTLSDPKGYIGLVSVSHAAWADPNTFIGLTTSVIGSLPSIYGKVATLGNTAGDGTGDFKYLLVDGDGNLQVDVANSVRLSGSTNYIGLVTSTLAAVNTNTFLGLVTVAPHSLTVGTAFIGLVTSVVSTTARTITGNLTLSDSKDFIGLVSVSGFTNPLPVSFSGNVTLDDGSLTGLVAGANYIGLTTTVIGNAPILGASTNYIGLVTVANTVATTHIGNMTLSDAKTYIGLVTSTLGVGTSNIGLVTLNAGAQFIGLTTVVQGGGGTKYIGLTTTTLGVGTSNIGLVTLSASNSWVGLVTTTNGVGTSFIGLVTAWTRNAGSAKTLTQRPIAFSLASLATICVPTNANTIYVTNMILSSDATVRIAIKSGATYLTGNASIGITLNPAGGFVQTGSPDSPCYIGLPSGSFNFEKQDIGSTVARIGGDLIYFEE